MHCLMIVKPNSSNYVISFGTFCKLTLISGCLDGEKNRRRAQHIKALNYSISFTATAALRAKHYTSVRFSVFQCLDVSTGELLLHLIEVMPFLSRLFEC